MPVTLLNEVNDNSIGTEWLSDGGCKSLLIDAVDFGGGTVTIQVKRYNGEWVIPVLPDGTLAQFTSNTFQKFDYAGFGIYVRAILTGSSGASKVNVYLG